MASEEEQDALEGRLARGEAWSDFCRRLDEVGRRILEDDFPADPRDRAEGFRHLGRLTVYALQWFVEFNDERFPAFHRYDDDVVKWGGPNVDNVYLRAKIDPRLTYRLSGDLRAVRGLIVSLPEGEMQLGQLRVFAERSLDELDVAPDGSFELRIVPGAGAAASGGADPRRTLVAHPGTDHLLVRVFVSDWEHDRVPELHVECLESEGTSPARPDPATLADRLDRAATWIERTVVFWNERLRRQRAARTDNRIDPPAPVPGGATDIAYGSGFWSLAPEQALLIECEPPDARYWCVQLYSPAWFESLDFANRVTSLNGHQMHVDDDGKFRAVVAHRDPGVPNWLDTEGRPAGLISIRWVWTRTHPTPSCRVVDLAEIRSLLPAGHPSFDDAARRRQIALRRAAVARRFRH